jgi:hypothetical protein
LRFVAFLLADWIKGAVQASDFQGWIETPMQIAGINQQDQLPASVARPPLMKWLPEFGGIIWLVLLGAAIWFHTHASLQPPIYDAFTYYEKASQFWSTMHRMQPFNPLNLQPTFRPPGTVLMSYPFGFNPDPRGFYFRSIYFPVVLLLLAVLATAYDVRDSLIVRAQTVLTAAFFCTPTILYQFEMGAGTGSYWGLVDGFLAGLAALAAAAAWRGTQASSASWAWLWAAVAAFASCLSILVKPTGTLVAAVVGIAWVVFALARVVGVWSSCADRRRLIMRLLAGAVMIGALDGLVLLAGVSSRYLSRDNMQAGLANIAIMKTELSCRLCSFRSAGARSCAGSWRTSHPPHWWRPLLDGSQSCLASGFG